MPRGPVESGWFQETWPFVRMGEGPQRLVVLPGLNDALQPVTKAPRFWKKLFREQIRGRTIHVVSRRRDLPRGLGTPGMAAEYARVLREENLLPADVMGISMGGMIAQHLAADHPDGIDRLVLAVCCARAPDSKLRLYGKWREQALAGRWREAYADMLRKSHEHAERWPELEWFHASPNALLRQALDPADLIVSIEACVNHDSRAEVGRIQAPTLVLGGTHDRLIQEDACRALASRIPNARLHILEGAGHTLLEDRSREVAGVLNPFLASPR